MAKTATVTIGLAVIGDGIALNSWGPRGSPIVNTNAPAAGPFSYALGIGDNTLAIPPNAIGFIIEPPLTSVVVKKLKYSGADTGWTIAPALPSQFCFDTTKANLIINSSAIETVWIAWF